MEQEFNQPAQQGVDDLQALFRSGGEPERVSDYGLMSLVDAEGVADQSSALERYKAGKDARVEILQKKFGRTSVVPTQSLVPYDRFRFQQGRSWRAENCL